jgi:hypothetical protein
MIKMYAQMDGFFECDLYYNYPGIMTYDMELVPIKN